MDALPSRARSPNCCLPWAFLPAPPPALPLFLPPHSQTCGLSGVLGLGEWVPLYCTMKPSGGLQLRVQNHQIVYWIYILCIYRCICVIYISSPVSPPAGTHECNICSPQPGSMDFTTEHSDNAVDFHVSKTSHTVAQFIPISSLMEPSWLFSQHCTRGFYSCCTKEKSS